MMPDDQTHRPPSAHRWGFILQKNNHIEVRWWLTAAAFKGSFL